jgi:hypothetical protein
MLINYASLALLSLYVLDLLIWHTRGTITQLHVIGILVGTLDMIFLHISEAPHYTAGQ